MNITLHFRQRESYDVPPETYKKVKSFEEATAFHGEKIYQWFGEQGFERRIHKCMIEKIVVTN
jgi:hypothetical protein|tara:strand:- start:4452 stop:4640 length:189 start_codon:yes stop_codon:yes gene_type:complete